MNKNLMTLINIFNVTYLGSKHEISLGLEDDVENFENILVRGKKHGALILSEIYVDIKGTVSSDMVDFFRLFSTSAPHWICGKISPNYTSHRRGPQKEISG
jgi:hypothetical protein